MKAKYFKFKHFLCKNFQKTKDIKSITRLMHSVIRKQLRIKNKVYFLCFSLRFTICEKNLYKRIFFICFPSFIRGLNAMNDMMKKNLNRTLTQKNKRKKVVLFSLRVFACEYFCLTNHLSHVFSSSR